VFVPLLIDKLVACSRVAENKIPSVAKYYKINAFLLHEIAASSGELNSLGYLYLEKLTRLHIIQNQHNLM